MSEIGRAELLESVRPQYSSASRNEKKQLLDNFMMATGYNRKHAIVLLKNGARKAQQKRGRVKSYGEEIQKELVFLWQTASRICSKRLIPFLPVLIAQLEKFDHLSVSAEVKEKLLALSPATADRLLQHEREQYGTSKSTTRPGYLLKKSIPIRTFSDWNDAACGFTEADLVAHCGETTAGKYVNTLTVTDIATGWTELVALLHKTEAEVSRGLVQTQQQLPFLLLGLDTDNGGEFINYAVKGWCERNSITFTRARECKKNDQAHVEEKNGSIVRRIIGYNRYEGKESMRLLSELYSIARLYVNFFQPSLKLKSKERIGGLIRKRYERAQTPYEKVLKSPAVPKKNKQTLQRLFETLDPLRLRNDLEKAQEELWKTAIIRKPSKPAQNKDEAQPPAPQRTRHPKKNTSNNASKIKSQCPSIKKSTIDEVWDEISQRLQKDPSLSARKLIRMLVERDPKKFRLTQASTIQSRLTKWRKAHRLSITIIQEQEQEQIQIKKNTRTNSNKAK